MALKRATSRVVLGRGERVQVECCADDGEVFESVGDMVVKRPWKIHALDTVNNMSIRCQDNGVFYADEQEAIDKATSYVQAPANAQKGVVMVVFEARHIIRLQPAPVERITVGDKR